MKNWINYQGIQNRYGAQSSNLTEALRYFSYSFIASIIISSKEEFKIGSNILLSNTQIKILLICCITFILIDIFQYTVSSLLNFILANIIHIDKKLYKKDSSSQYKIFDYKKENDDTEKIFELDCISVFIYEIFLPILFFLKFIISLIMIISALIFLITTIKSI
ncbi:hypothetical protein GCL60_16405 [Silvanigrella paludirubra]|uniref:Uncharacterized protein n=1 Tax=Silvanigrella paludirubra TaxID=2499159 RepID=A0A6N6VQ79_9BACT|nr:hypothetical protein [Silvanigrella paludirubra]KAB8035810.1 hypothetical protein GCL60_16405 [Silvanigrella paludirubra]